MKNGKIEILHDDINENNAHYLSDMEERSKQDSKETQSLIFLLLLAFLLMFFGMTST